MITSSITSPFVRGVDHLEETARGLRPHRLPGWVEAQQSDPQLQAMQLQPAGVRIVADTTARRIELVTHATWPRYAGLDRPRGRIDLVVNGELLRSDECQGGDAIQTDLTTGRITVRAGAPHTSRFDDLPAGDKRVELWLPHNESVELIEVRSDAPLTVAPDDRPRWLHHGSSISQGSNAASPAATWASIAARIGGVELRNLGFGGSALVDPFMARVMRDTPDDLISVKVGINVVNADAMRLRAFIPAVHGFLDTLRDGHPMTPIWLISPLHCPIHESTPGPGAFDPSTFSTGTVRFIATGEEGDTSLGRLTLEVIREAMASVAAQRSDDPHLHFLDGQLLYGADDALRHPLPDNLHPDTATHAMIATRFAGRVWGASE